MDMSVFNTRKRAEEGVFLPLCHPFTGVAIGEGGKAPGFLIRGTAARSVQSRIGEMQKKAQEAADGDEKAVMEALHESMIDTAMRYIIGAQNIENEGVQVEEPDQIRAVLDMTFPEMEIAKDGQGKTIMITSTGEDGKEVTVPKFEMTNKPFAKQVIDAAEDGARFLGPISAA
ncbi:MAG: hypothetical protein AB3N24_05960 [Leisingera sp.]